MGVWDALPHSKSQERFVVEVPVVVIPCNSIHHQLLSPPGPRMIPRQRYSEEKGEEQGTEEEEETYGTSTIIV